MTRLRDDVRDAFERDQSALGDVGRVRDRLMHQALAAREVPPSHRLQWAAAIAAVLIAAIVMTTLILARAGTHPHALPAATPSSNPLKKNLSVPDATAVIVYSDPVNADQIDGVTWDGKTSGRLNPQPQPASVGNPQNNLFADVSSIVDRSGDRVMTGNFGGKFFTATWSDDGRHLCLMTPAYLRGGSANGVPAVLQLITVGGSTRNVAQVATIFEQVNTYVAACSTLADRAVVVQSGGQGIGTAQVWVVQLSSGHVIWTYSFDPAHLNVQIVASRDAAYVAANVTTGSKPAGSTVFGPDGSVAAHLDQFVEQFSWDDSLAVVDEGYGTTPVDLISWRVGTVFWSCPPDTALIRALPEPDGTELAIWVAPMTQFQQQKQFPDLIVVAADGSIVFSVVQTGTA